MRVRHVPARHDLGFLTSLYAVVLSGSVSTHRLSGTATDANTTTLVRPHRPRDAGQSAGCYRPAAATDRACMYVVQVSGLDVEGKEVRAHWSSLHLGPCLEVGTCGPS